MSLLRSNKGIVLALGGGGARGFAHVGVMEVLHQHGVKVEGIVGTSAGAVAGAGYALGHTPEEMRERVLQFSQSRLATEPRVRALVDGDRQDTCEGWSERLDRFFYKSKMLRSLLLSESVLDPAYMSRVVDFFLPDVDMRNTVIPFAVVATDLKSGEAVILDQGPMRRAVTASCSVPGVAPLVEVNGFSLVDGGVVCLVPSRAARRAFGNKPVLAVNLSRDPSCAVLPTSALEIYFRASEVQNITLSRLQMEEADLAVAPQVEEVHWADFTQAELVMDRGRQAAEEAWPQIKKLALSRRWPWARN